MRELSAVPVVLGLLAVVQSAVAGGLGIKLYNPGIQMTLPEMRRLSGGGLSVLGKIPPRDVLAQGSPDDVRAAVKRVLEQTPDRSRLVLFCAGGMPPESAGRTSAPSARLRKNESFDLITPAGYAYRFPPTLLETQPGSPSLDDR